MNADGEAKVVSCGGCKKTTRRHYHQQQWSQRGKLVRQEGKWKEINALFHRSKLFCQHLMEKNMVGRSDFVLIFF